MKSTLLDEPAIGDDGAWRELLLRARKERHLTRRDLSRASGVSTAAIRAYETGARHPGAAALKSVIAALGLPGERANRILAGAGYAHDPQALLRLAPVSREDLVADLHQRTWPAFVLNQAFEVVLSNDAFNRAFDVVPGEFGRSERSFLVHISDAAFAGRLLNWDEVVTFMIGLVKGDPRWAGDLGQPLTWIAPGLDGLTEGSPELVARLARLWDAAPAIKPTLRFKYHIEWLAPDGHELSFVGIAMLADIWDELHWNEWIPSDRRTWEWFEKLPSGQ